MAAGLRARQPDATNGGFPASSHDRRGQVAPMACLRRLDCAGSFGAVIYSPAMDPPATPSSPGHARIFGWRRVRLVLISGAVLGILLLAIWEGSRAMLYLRLVMIGLVQLLVFGLFERWPTRLPRWMARWGLQVAGVAIVLPFAVALVYTLTTMGDAVHWSRDGQRQSGFVAITVLGLLVTPWIAMSALYRQVSGAAQRQALAFDLERSEHRRQALDARLHRLQAQVEPHFLFNTLANVRELVDAQSPQASVVLGHLIAYLRAAVPRLNEPATTIAQEIDLARDYLEVMRMRMPDRLQFDLHVDATALPLRCPPMALLTLVENAVRHGIDPSEVGGRIDVRVQVRDGRCRVEVVDSGVGLHHAGQGTGTGLANLRERLQLACGDTASLVLLPVEPRGVRVELQFPAVQGTA